MSARERIERWIEASRRVTRPAAGALVEAIAKESGLSIEGARFVLDGVLEVDRAPTEIERFIGNSRLSAIGERSAVAVVLSSTVPTAAFRAIAWALAQSPKVIVRPSRHGTALVSAIAAATPGSVELVPPSERPEEDLRELVDALGPRGALHVYGGADVLAESERATRERPDLHVELHGPGAGAIVARARDVVEHAKAIALDVVAFDQRGCLSPRIVLVTGHASEATEALHRELLTLDVAIPRGDLDDAERAAIRLACDAAWFKGRVLEGTGHAVLEPAAVDCALIGPVGRVLPVLGVGDIDEAIERLRPFAAQLTRIAATDEWRDRLSTIASTCALGEMQRPPFDGPVDRRIR